MRSASALGKYRGVPFNFQATPGLASLSPVKTKLTSRFLARFKIGYYSSLVVSMLCLTVASETIDWILVDHLKSIYVKNVTYKSKHSSESCQYRILRKGYILLVSIKAGNADDPIELEMNHVKFHSVTIYGDLPPFFPNVPTYEVLSYTWGECIRRIPCMSFFGHFVYHLHFLVVYPSTRSWHSAWQVLNGANESNGWYLVEICTEYKSLQ
ncbi:uncharacterized protein Bfra_000277 [Botrytis fragariae]|uniref:Uncharacterized protein n=1 Tax=Botrytis fragariae TaxID=1964551 RepID=A0A8H6B2T2_9HELO|nr:uncharacterized protein Bfra_000277 [Botrytis fragariae]KAF5878110.1 hypothetical protein Bfra_000277 [Botrytis fragariae]